MSESHLSRGELIERIRLLEVWQRASQRAPHEPLAILLAPARLDRGVTQPATFEQLEDPWNQPLKELGPLRGSYHAEFRFQHFRLDIIGEVPNAGMRRAHSSATLVPKDGVVENLYRRRGVRAA